MNEMRKLPVRLALRTEGQWWVAYLAHAHTMAGSREIGRILLDIATTSAERKAQFKELMEGCMADGIEALTGARPEMQTEDAPESERSGRA